MTLAATPSTGQCDLTLFADAALLRRVQQHNQQQIISRLLHDLRNPVHSMRITIELFSRLIGTDADTAALLARAARYVRPAEAALASLSKQTERLTVYLSPAARPEPSSIAVNEWLAESAMLLRESTCGLQVSVESALADETGLWADRPRLSHALLRWGLSHAGAPAVLNARATDPHRIQLGLSYASPKVEASAAPFDPQELRTLIENAGGALVEQADRGITLSFAAAG